MTRRLASALVCSGTEKGGLAVGYARSEKSPDAVMKADAMSVNHRLFIELYEDRTLFSPLMGKFNQTRVKILPGKLLLRMIMKHVEVMESKEVI